MQDTSDCTGVIPFVDTWRAFSDNSLASDLSGTLSYMGYLELFSSYTGYLELSRVPRVIWGTSNRAGYLKLCRIPLIMKGTFIRAGYLGLCRAPQITLELFRSSTRGVLLPFLFFPPNNSQTQANS